MGDCPRSKKNQLMNVMSRIGRKGAYYELLTTIDLLLPCETHSGALI